MLGAGALGWPREMVWGGRWEGGSGLGTHVHLWQIHVDVWQNQYSIVKWNKVKFKKKEGKGKGIHLRKLLSVWVVELWTQYGWILYLSSWTGGGVRMLAGQRKHAPRDGLPSGMALIYRSPSLFVTLYPHFIPMTTTKWLGIWKI